jgi:hypothetical protein
MKILRILHLMFALAIAAALYVGLSSNLTRASRTSGEVPAGKPDARIDLGSLEGVHAVKGEWRYSDK